MRIKYGMKLLFNVVKVGVLKIRFGNRLTISWKQLLGKRFDLSITDDGSLSIGKKLFTRNDVHIIVQNGKMKLGSNIFINNNVAITCIEKIEIEDDVTIANNVVIVDHDHDLEHASKFISCPVRIGKGAWIGANSVILKGVTIGEGAVVAAGSVVTRNVESYQVVAGVPAKAKKHINYKRGT